MAVALGAHTFALGSAVTSVTTTGVTTQTSGSTFLVFTPIGDWSDLIDSKGNVYTAKRIQNSGGTAIGYLYECRNGVGGTGHTVQVVFAASGSYTVHFVEVTGAAGVDVDVGDYDAISSSAYDVTTPALETSGELLLLFGGANTTGTTSTIAATGSFTVQDKNENGSGYCPSVFATYSPSGQTAVTGGFTCGTQSTTGFSIIVSYTPTLSTGGRRQEYLEVSAFGTGLTRTTNFTTTPTAGNFLISAIAVDKNAGTITIPSGWTQIGTNYSGPSISLAVAYKSASGSETGVTWNWATTQAGGSACWIAEIASPVALGGVAQADSADVAVSTQTSGTATAGTNAILGLALFAIDSDTNFFSEANPFPTFSNSFEIERGTSAVVAGWPGLYVARKALSGSGSVETTITSGNTTDQVAAQMITINNVPSVTVYGSLGQWDPCLRIEGWF